MGYALFCVSSILLIITWTPLNACWMKKYVKTWEMITVLVNFQFFPEAFLEPQSQWVWHSQLLELLVSEVVWFHRVSLLFPNGLVIPGGPKVHPSFLFVSPAPSAVLDTQRVFNKCLWMSESCFLPADVPASAASVTHWPGVSQLPRCFQGQVGNSVSHREW